MRRPSGEHRIVTQPRETPPRAAKLVEVARAARVSPSTVSRILNGTAFVADEKREAVLTAIEQLGFQPNPLARGLRQGRRMTIGVLAQTVESPFFGTTFRGIAEALAGSDYTPLIIDGPQDAASEAKRVEFLLSRRVDGVIIPTCVLPDDLLVRYSREVPLVVGGRDLHGANLFAMKLDNVLGARLATRHLLELGHRRIAYFKGPENHIDAVERVKGYRLALREACVPHDPGLLLQAGFLAEHGEAAVERLLDARRPFTAIFAANDECAYGIRLGLYRRGIRVPEDVSLVGFDDLPGSRFSTPPLTSVRQPLEEIGRRAARSLLDLLDHREPSTADMPQVQLVVRDTTAPPR